MKRERGIEVKVGALVLFSLALLGAFVVILGDFGLDEGVEVFADFRDTGGLKPGAAVKQGGIEIGKVHGIEFMNGEPNPVTKEPIWARIEMRIDSERFDSIRESSDFYITTEGILGEKFVNVETNDLEAAAAERGHIFRGVDPLRLEQMVSKVSRSIDSLNRILDNSDLPVGDVLKHIDRLAIHADEILVDNRDKVGRVIENADTLLVGANQTLEENREPLRSLLANANTLTGDAAQTLLALKNVVSRIERDLRPVLERVQSVLNDAESLFASGQRVLEDAEPRIASILQDADEAASNLNHASSQVASMTDYVHSGQGTVGMLLRDEEIFDTIREMLRELKRQPWKIIWKE